MFKQSRIKIIAAVMAALLLFLMITLSVIYASSYHQISQENKELLEEFCESFSLKENTTPPDGNLQPGGPMGDMGEMGEGGRDDFDFTNEPIGGRDDFEPGDRHAFELSTFYFVAVSDSGEVLTADTGDSNVYEVSEIIEMAEDILEDGDEEGSEDGLLYLVTEKDGYRLVAFKDNSVVRSNMETLFRNTLISFAIAVVVVFLLSLLLSKKIIAPLEENDQRQKQFVSDAGHELKTPLAVMSANCELLSKEIGSNQWLDNIVYENNRMSTLVKDLLNLSRAENGVLQEEEIDLSNLVIGESLPFESIAFEQGLMLETNVKDGVLINGNSSQLKQLTAILIDNAISHSEGGDSVELSLNSDSRSAHLEVTNYGKEIPAEKLPLIFERFYRLDEARTEDGDNHYGLGLAIAKAITQAHGGKISVECRDGKVTFRADLPIK